MINSSEATRLNSIMDKLRTTRVIYVGENHNALADHQLQLDVLRQMTAQGQPLAIGAEWFQARFQATLDRYISGEIDEATMLKGTEYFSRWGFDYRLYRPIMQFAREHKLPVLALNASRELVQGIRKDGINELPAALKAELPDDYDFSDKVYEEKLRQIFNMHQRDDAQFQRFLEVQLTWDESMANNAASWLQANPNGRLLILAGNGHISGHHGIPQRVERRTGIRGQTLSNYDPDSARFNHSDYLALYPTESLPPKGLMKAFLDVRDEGVFIRAFSANSPAEAAGMQTGDRIIAVNGVATPELTSFKLTMLDHHPKEKITVTVSRDSFFSGEKEIDLVFELSGDKADGFAHAKP